MANKLRLSKSRLYKLLDIQNRSRIVCKTFSSQADEPRRSVSIDKDDHITLIGLNRPNSRNSIDKETAKCLHEALNTFQADKSSPVAVIYGVGGSFCSGQDLHELENQCETKNLYGYENTPCNQHYLRRHPQKPIVCGISGYCVADGLELALFCDLRVMEDTAILGFFGRPIGHHLRWGGAARLPAIIGCSRSLDLLLTGRRLSGKEALKIGLANRLVATGTALGQAVNLAFSIAKFPFEPLQRDRNNIYINYYERRKGLHAAIQRETMPINMNAQTKIKENIIRFNNSKTKGLKSSPWQVKPKVVPDWEQQEILHEKPQHD